LLIIDWNKNIHYGHIQVYVLEHPAALSITIATPTRMAKQRVTEFGLFIIESISKGQISVIVEQRGVACACKCTAITGMEWAISPL